MRLFSYCRAIGYRYTYTTSYRLREMKTQRNRYKYPIGKNPTEPNTNNLLFYGVLCTPSARWIVQLRGYNLQNDGNSTSIIWPHGHTIAGDVSINGLNLCYIQLCGGADLHQSLQDPMVFHIFCNCLGIL